MMRAITLLALLYHAGAYTKFVRQSRAEEKHSVIVEGDGSMQRPDANHKTGSVASAAQVIVGGDGSLHQSAAESSGEGRAGKIPLQVWQHAEGGGESTNDKHKKFLEDEKYHMKQYPDAMKARAAEHNDKEAEEDEKEESPTEKEEKEEEEMDDAEAEEEEDDEEGEEKNDEEEENDEDVTPTLAVTCPNWMCSQCEECMQERIVGGRLWKAYCTNKDCRHADYCKELIAEGIRNCNYWSGPSSQALRLQSEVCITNSMCNSNDTALCDTWRGANCGEGGDPTSFLLRKGSQAAEARSDTAESQSVSRMASQSLDSALSKKCA